MDERLRKFQDVLGNMSADELYQQMINAQPTGIEPSEADLEWMAEIYKNGGLIPLIIPISESEADVIQNPPEPNEALKSLFKEPSSFL